MLTLSKASYVALFLCLIFGIKPFNYRYSKIIELVFILSVLFLFILFFQQISELSIFKRTLNMFNESDSSLEIRGYKVFFESNSEQYENENQEISVNFACIFIMIYAKFNLSST